MPRMATLTLLALMALTASAADAEATERCTQEGEVAVGYEVPISLLQLNMNVSQPRSAKARPRVIFAAGMEGSGHHYVETLWDALEEAVPEVHFAHVDLGMDLMLMNNTELNRTMKAAFEKLLHEPDIENTVWALPECVSYPCGAVHDHQGRLAQLYNPNMKWYAEVAKEVGIDLRVIFLYRPLEDALKSGCVNRPIEPCDRLLETMIATEPTLANELRIIESDVKVTCLKYGSAPDMGAALESTLRDIPAVDGAEMVSATWVEGGDDSEQVSATLVAGGDNSEQAEEEIEYSKMPPADDPKMQQLAERSEELSELCEAMAPVRLVDLLGVSSRLLAPRAHELQKIFAP